MTYPASVFRVLIASPSDVADEREIAVRTIQEWNDLNSHERQIVLLPLRWETHSSPEYGERPQAIINKQVADHCDLVIGIFWTRVGTPTGVNESGTVEEIERAANNGKPVMLYFSQARQEPDSIELEQLAKLRDFKRRTLPNALIETYSSHIEFKDKLTRQLEIRLRELIASLGKSNQSHDIAIPATDIRLHFAATEHPGDAGIKISRNSQYFKLLNLDLVPDFMGDEPAADKNQTKSSDEKMFWAPLQPKHNKDYYRQSITFRTVQLFFTPISFWLKNLGSIGARDIHVDLSITSDTLGLTVVGPMQLPTSPPNKMDGGYGLLSSGIHRNDPMDIIAVNGSYWTTQFDIAALQPQREIFSPIQFFLGSTQSCLITVGATIYADTLPEPSRQVLEIELDVDVVELEAKNVLPE